MAEPDSSNGVYVEPEAIGDGEDSSDFTNPKQSPPAPEITLRLLLNRIAAAVFFSDPDTPGPLLHRLKVSLSENIPLLREASQNTARNVYAWTRQGSPFRALLVASVGTIALLALTGLLTFMVFFVLATINAIVVSLLMSLAAAGGFLAIFFACLTGIYIGALSLAVFVISTTTISAIVVAFIATGWIGFFFTVWLVMTKSFSLAKHTMNMTGSALSAYSSARHAKNE
nr:Tegument protein [Ipomoea batatas]